jgi:hypothetical protein
MTRMPANDRWLLIVIIAWMAKCSVDNCTDGLRYDSCVKHHAPKECGK